MRDLVSTYGDLKTSRKIVVGTLTLFFILLALQAVTGYFMIYRSHFRLERQQVEMNGLRVREALERELDHLDNFIGDWSSWDDTWDFLDSPYQEYIESNLGREALLISSINLMIFIRPDRSVLWRMVVDPESEEIIYPDAFVGKRFPEEIPLPEGDSSVRGMLLTEHGVILLVLRPVLHSDGTGPMNGYLVFGRFISRDLVSILQSSIHVEFEIHPADRVPGEIAARLPERIRAGEPVFFSTRHTAYEYYLLEDLRGALSLFIAVRTPRTLSDQGREGLLLYLLSTMINLAAAGYFLIRFSENHLIRPVNSLMVYMVELRDSRDFSKRLVCDSRDEFGIMADSFNKLLEIIENQTERLQEQNLALEEMAHKDELTGLFNRRYFNTRIRSLTEERRKGESPVIAVLMMDIDHFKLYNDTYGHQAGDLCISAVAGTIRRNVTRPADLSARFGGEEFIVLLFSTDREGALSVARRIMEDLKGLKLQHVKSPVESFVTMSIGISCGVLGDEKSVEKLISRADSALYESKENGRNRVTVE